MSDPAIHLTDVRFRWRPAAPIVLDITTLVVDAGERVFIQGPSGGGKTTLLNLLGGFAVPETGSVGVLGRDLAGLGGARRDAFRADNIGFIFQMFNLVPYLSVVDNVTLPCRFSGQRRAHAGGETGGVDGAARRLLGHMGLDLADLAGRPVTDLSAGQQQRVAVARALIGSPPLIIADEPTSALDADARDTFVDLLFREVEAAAATLLFVSHDSGLARLFDRALSLADINRRQEVA